MNAATFFKNYSERLSQALEGFDWDQVTQLSEAILRCHREDRAIYLCGNGGSAANANHLVNDLLYSIYQVSGKGLRVEALTANNAVLTCLGNDINYENIFAHQLKAKGRKSDLLIALSGSGNSQNVVNAIHVAKALGMETISILGFDGGHCKSISDKAIHFPVQDMQLAEDLQIMAGHMVTQWLVETLRREEGIETGKQHLGVVRP